MASNSRQPATRAFVNASIEAANRYAESLFDKAVERLNARIVEERTDAASRLEARLQEALAMLRPAPTVYPLCSPPDLPTAAAPAALSRGWTELRITRADGRLRLSLR